MIESFNTKYKKAIVTGGAGFIGSHIVKELLDMGLEVISIDNYSSGNIENLREFRNDPKFHEHSCDITDYMLMKQYFKGVDIVFNEAAAKKTSCMNNPERDLAVNAKGAFNIFRLSKEFDVKKVVHASTGSVYGEPIYFPQDENHPLNPTSFYGVNKLAGEKYAMAFAHLYDMDITVLRYFHVYGPKQDSSDLGGVIPIFCRRSIEGKAIKIYGDGSQQRSFTHVSDIVKANIIVAQTKETKGQSYNCASGIKVTIKELADKVLIMSGRMTIEYRDWMPGDIKIFDIDNSKIKRLGMEFMTDFDKGLKDTFEWYNRNLK
ncbi:MAG: SDR family NAD(P)-dependent oxidoreductase [Parcubacteria group bacterium]